MDESRSLLASEDASLNASDSTLHPPSAFSSAGEEPLTDGGLLVSDYAVTEAPSSSEEMITVEEEIELTKCTKCRNGFVDLLRRVFCSRGKLGMVNGVIIPTTLNIFGVILFLRLTLVIGQCGVWGACLEMIVAYAVTTLTSISIAAICTNGRVKGGGAYYMLSRSIGPEIGGAVGLVFYLGAVAGGVTYIMGFAESFVHCVQRFYPPFPDSPWFMCLYAFVALTLLFIVVFIGAQTFADTSTVILVVLVAALLFSVGGFIFARRDVMPGFTSWSWSTFVGNFKPTFGPDVEKQELNAFKIFGIMFPACTGIMAGINLSGDLADPKNDIPKGTLIAVGGTFASYISFIFLIAFTTMKQALLTSYRLTQDVTPLPILVSFGIFAAALSSCLSNFIGGAKVLQAVAKDRLLPLLCWCGMGFGKNKEPRIGVIFTYIFQVLILVVAAALKRDLNWTAPYATQFHIIAYGFTNFACFVLSISGAPNFRPLFKCYGWATALLGTIACIVTMILCDYISAAVAVVVMIVLIIFIHFYAEKKTWGNVTQALIYHQVRKYLLKLDVRQENAKFWRFQPLLMVSNPRHCVPLILFINNLKKGGTFIIGNVKRGSFDSHCQKILVEHEAWIDFIAETKIKAFPEIGVGHTIRAGMQNLMMIGGIGAMKPNAIILGFYDEQVEDPAGGTIVEYEADEESDESPVPEIRITEGDQYGPPEDEPTDVDESEERDRPHGSSSSDEDEEEGEIVSKRTALSALDNFPETAFTEEDTLEPEEYVAIIRDAISFQKSVVVARGFHTLDRTVLRPSAIAKKILRAKDHFIDLWIPCLGDWEDHSVVLTLQLGFIINQVDLWRYYHRLRLIYVVETPEEVSPAREHMKIVLQNYRITNCLCYAVPLTNAPSAEDLLSMMPYSRLNMENKMRLHNELILKYSGHHTSFIFTTLPEPPGEDGKPLEYLNQLRILTDNIPPTMLIYGAINVISTEM